MTRARLRNEMNRRCFEYGGNFSSLRQLQIGHRLPCHKGDKLEAGIDNNLCQNAGRRDFRNSSAQMVSCAALLSSALFKRYVFASNTNVEVAVLAARICRGKHGRSDLQECNSALPSRYATGHNGLD